MSFKKAATLCLSLTLLAPMLPARAAEPDVLRSIFRDIEQIDPAEQESRLPYADGTVLSEFREPLAIYGGGTRIYGDENNPSAATLGWKSLPAARLRSGSVTIGGKSYSFTGKMQLFKTAAGDFKNTGRENGIAAVVGAKSTDGRAFLLLCTGDADLAQPLEPTAILYEGASTAQGDIFFDSEKWSGAISVICADFNGDGYDEIATTTPTRGIGEAAQSGEYSFDRRANTLIWYLSDDKTEWCATPFEIGNGIGTWAYDCYLGAPGVSASVTAADINGDGKDDLISAVSTTDMVLKSGAVTNYFSLRIFYGAGELRQMLAERRNLIDYIRPIAPKELYLTYDSGDAACFDITTADIDGSGTPTIFVTFKRMLQNIVGLKNTRSYAPDFYVYSLDYNPNGTYTASQVYKGGIAHDGWIDPNRPDVSDSEYIYKTAPKEYAPIRTGVLRGDFGLSDGEKGVVGSGTLLVDKKYISFFRRANGSSYEYTTRDNGCFTGSAPSGTTSMLYDKKDCILFNDGVDILDIRTASVSQDADAALITANTSGGVKGYFLTSASGKYPTGVSAFCTSANGVMTAMPNTDNDAIYLKYKKHAFFWADPVIVAALASPPYFDALPSDNYTNSQTTYGRTSSSATGRTESFTVSAGTYVSTEIKAGSHGAAGVFESEISQMTHSTLEQEQTTEVSYTQSFSTHGGENTVVLSTVAYDAYAYTAYYAGAAGTLQASPYTVYVPRGGSSAMRLASLNYEDYLDLRPYAKDALPDLADVFPTPGKPETYPTALSQPTGANYIGKMLYPTAGNFPANLGSQTQTMDITNDTTTVTSSGSSVSVKLGGGFEFESDTIFGPVEAGAKVTGGAETEKEYEGGKITANAIGTSFEGTVCGQGEGMNVSGTGEAKGEFSWQLLRYIYTNNPTKDSSVVTQEFPVITYLLSGLTQPAGAIPERLILSDTNVKLTQVGPATPGYRSAATLTVKAVGLTRESATSLEGAPLGMTLYTGDTNIGTSNAFPFDIVINANVQPGTYTVYLNIGGVRSEPITVEVEQYVAPTYLAADKTALDFGSARYAHSGGTPSAAAQQITVENIHSEDVSGLKAMLPENSSFEISEKLSASTLAPGAAATLSVRPKTGLSVGTHTDTLFITNEITAAYVELSFTVTEPTVPGQVVFDYEGESLSNPVQIGVHSPLDDGGDEVIYYLYTVKGHKDYLDENGEQIWKKKSTDPGHGVRYYFTISLGEEYEIGCSYDIGVKAVNSLGESLAEWHNFKIRYPAGTPDKVQNVTAVAGDGCVALSWDPPEYWGENEHEPVITARNYSIQYLNRGVGPLTGHDGWHSMNESVITRLDNGVPCIFSIYAYNQDRWSDPYEITLTPQAAAATPSRPTELSVGTSYKTAVFSWYPPAYDGGVDVTGYEVSSDGGNTWENIGNVQEYTCSELAPCEAFTFSVRAVNSAGAGNAATLTTPIPSKPIAPTYVVFNGYEQLDLEITPDTDNPPDYYELRINGDSWQKIEPISFGDTLHYVIGNLTNDTDYEISLRGCDADGAGSVSTRKAYPTSQAPMPVINPRVEPRNGAIAIFGESPDGDSVKYNLDNNGWSTLWGSSVYAENDVPHTIAIGREGLGGRRTAAYFVVTPDSALPKAPEGLTVSTVVRKRSVTLSWTLDDKGNDDVMYEVSRSWYNHETDEEYADTITLPSTENSYTFTAASDSEMQRYTHYGVTAINSVGDMSDSAYVASQIKPPAVLSLPVGYSAAASGSFRLMARWDGENYTDVGERADWTVESAYGEITWDAEKRCFNVAPGLAAGEYEVLARADMYGVIYEGTLTVRVGAFAQISSAAQTDTGFSAALILPDNTVRPTLAAASYDADGRLCRVTLTAAADTAINVKMDLSSAKTLKLMLWQDLRTMYPLCEPKTLTLR